MTRFRVGLLSSLGALLLTLGACANATSGKITGKEFSPAHSEFSHFQCFSYDTKGNCTVNMPMYEDLPDRWLIHLYNEQDEEEGTVMVTPQEYDRLKVGQSYPEAR